jgi:hypothetical protein
MRNQALFVRLLASGGVIALALVCSLLVVGCDEDDDDAPAATATPAYTPTSIPTPLRHVVVSVNSEPQSTQDTGLITVRASWSGGLPADGVPVLYELLTPNAGSLSVGYNAVPPTHHSQTVGGMDAVVFNAVPDRVVTRYAYIRVTVGGRMFNVSFTIPPLSQE